MEKIIHFTVPEKVTPIQAQVIERARTLHPAWEIKVWQDPIRPNGCLLEKYWSKANSGAQLSDLLRIDILYKWGGVYVDGDLRLIKPLDDLVDKYDCFVASENGTSLEGAIIGARKAHPAIKKLIDELLSNEPDWSLSPDKTTGPDLFAHTLRWDKSVTVLPRETFYCYPAAARSRKTHRHSYGEHLWAYSWKELNQIATTSWWKPVLGHLKRAATHVLRPTLTVGLRLWRGVKTLDRSLQQSNCYAVCDEIVVKTVHGYKIIVDGHDTSLTPELVFGGHYKSREEEFYKKILHGGDWVIDAGAHVGSYCMLAAQRVGSFGRIFAYEPNPKAIRLLARSIIMNWMHDRMVLRPVAAREIAKTERLAFIPERLGDASEGPDEMINSIIHETSKMIGVAPTKIDVACVSLDQEFPIDLPIKILRIDAEGREVAVLKGARRLLKRGCVDFILIRIFRQVPWPYWRNKIARSRWSELLIELNRLTQSNYAPCTLEADGSLVKHESVLTAIDNLQSQHIVMMARDQYSSEG